MVSKIKLENFTVFRRLELEPSLGINVFIGANGTGKTHLMKVAYAACDITKSGKNFAEKIIDTFLPTGRAIGRLVMRQKGSSRSSIEIESGSKKIRLSFTNHSKVPSSAAIKGLKEWKELDIESVFIPVKEMLSSAPGFRSLYSRREIYFEEIYADILDRAYIPPLRGPIDKERRKILNTLQEIIEGKVVIKNEEFYLRNRQGNLEFTLLAEGMRKLGLLWLLVQNGTLLNGSVLFWDEPEANLNPKLFGPLIEILLELHRVGVQIFLATHDYVILKELDLRMKDDDRVSFHSLYREDGEIRCHSSNSYLGIHHNSIAETFSDLYYREIERSIGG